MVITRVPVLIGEGIPLFGPVPRDIQLRHVGTRCYKGGLVQSKYELGATAQSAQERRGRLRAKIPARRRR